ncbi:MAG: hypothetical protein N4A72_07035 [Bacteroidales bacterium]|nr:hypothetical protein [Bacteroidales bacterium]
MYKLIILLVLIIWSYSCTSIKEEYFIGFEKIGKMNIDCELIHKNHLLLKGDSAFLYKEPYFVENGDTIRSASDGGFYCYRGHINKDKNQTSQYLSLTLINCDYCIRETLVDSITGNEIFKPEFITWTVEIGEKLIIDKIEYKHQQKEQFPIDLMNSYRVSELHIEETPEIELIE